MHLVDCFEQPFAYKVTMNYYYGVKNNNITPLQNTCFFDILINLSAIVQERYTNLTTKLMVS